MRSKDMAHLRQAEIGEGQSAVAHDVTLQGACVAPIHLPTTLGAHFGSERLAVRPRGPIAIVEARLIATG